MQYRTKTYIAGDWTGDKEAIDQLYKWKESNHWSLDFHDAHDITQACDSSLCCSIKRSLDERLNRAKTFVLVVGLHTKNLTKGGCQLCNSYNSRTRACARGMHIDYRSYIQYECEKAVRDGLKIIVLYNAARKNATLCPEILRNIGYHVAMKCWNGYTYLWNYQAVKAAFDFYG